MRVLLQRVLSARVEVDSEIVSQIGHGLLLFVGFSKSDIAADAESICQKVLNLPLFDDMASQDSSKNSVMQSNYELLIVSQFSLYGVFKGNRLDFHDAMPSEEAKPMYEFFHERLAQIYNKDKVKDGLFGVKRQVFLVNNGPMVLQLDSQMFANEN